MDSAISATTGKPLFQLQNNFKNNPKKTKTATLLHRMKILAYISTHSDSEEGSRAKDQVRAKIDEFWNIDGYNGKRRLEGG